MFLIIAAIALASICPKLGLGQPLHHLVWQISLCHESIRNLVQKPILRGLLQKSVRMSTHHTEILWPGETHEIKGTLTKHEMEKAPAAKHSHEAGFFVC